MKYLHFCIAAMTLCLLVASCGKITPSNDDPIKTGNATQITHNSAVLWGAVNPAALGQGVEMGIIVSDSENPSIENGRKFVSVEIDKNNMYFVEAKGLTAGTKYYYKAFLNASSIYRVGDVNSFTTKEYRLPEGAVDLGLPSDLKWATCNLGATTPEEYGDYYAWGATEPYYSSLNPLTWKSGKAGYDFYSYKWCNGSHASLTKYCTSNSYGIFDNKTVLDPEDDAACVKLGGSWRMPTDAEWTELRTNCTWKSASQNGVNGILVTGPNGNSLFLPSAGTLDGTTFHDVEIRGYYWSSSLSTDSPYAYDVYFGSFGVRRFSYNRSSGISIRPVSE